MFTWPHLMLRGLEESSKVTETQDLCILLTLHSSLLSSNNNCLKLTTSVNSVFPSYFVQLCVTLTLYLHWMITCHENCKNIQHTMLVVLYNHLVCFLI